MSENMAEIMINGVIYLILALGVILLGLYVYGQGSLITAFKSGQLVDFFEPGKIYVSGGDSSSLGPDSIDVSSPDCVNSGVVSSQYDVNLKKVNFVAKAKPKELKIDFYIVLDLRGKLIPGKKGNEFAVLTCSRESERVDMQCEIKDIESVKFHVQDDQPADRIFFHFTLWRKSVAVESFVQTQGNKDGAFSKMLDKNFPFYLSSFGVWEDKVTLSDACRNRHCDNIKDEDQCSQDSICYWNRDSCFPCSTDGNKVCQEYSTDECTKCEGPQSRCEVISQYVDMCVSKDLDLGGRIAACDQCGEGLLNPWCDLAECKSILYGNQCYLGDTRYYVTGNGIAHSCFACLPWFTCESFSDDICEKNDVELCGLHCSIDTNRVGLKTCVLDCSQYTSCDMLPLGNCEINICGLDCTLADNGLGGKVCEERPQPSGFVVCALISGCADLSVADCESGALQCDLSCTVDSTRTQCVDFRPPEVVP